MDLEAAQQRVWQRMYAPAATQIRHSTTAAWYGQLSRKTQGAMSRRLWWMHQQELRAARVFRQIAAQPAQEAAAALPQKLPEALGLCLQAESRRIPLYAAQIHQEPLGSIYEILCQQAKHHQFHLLSILGLLH